MLGGDSWDFLLDENVSPTARMTICHSFPGTILAYPDVPPEHSYPLSRLPSLEDTLCSDPAYREQSANRPNARPMSVQEEESIKSTNRDALPGTRQVGLVEVHLEQRGDESDDSWSRQVGLIDVHLEQHGDESDDSWSRQVGCIEVHLEQRGEESDNSWSWMQVLQEHHQPGHVPGLVLTVTTTHVGDRSAPDFNGVRYSQGPLCACILCWGLHWVAE